MKLRERISWLMGYVQKTLLPHLDECFDIPPTKHEQHLVAILEIVEVEKYVIRRSATQWLGRKLLTREAIARAYVAKAFCRYPTTRDLIRALQSSVSLRLICGFEALCDIPSEATFSRAFKEFSESALGERVHDALVQDYLADEIIGHISRDSTAIVGREKPAKKIKKAKKPRKRGRPAKGEKREPAKTRLVRQTDQSAEEAIAELSTVCDRGTKKNAKGYKTSWNGYKLHLDVNDVGLPVSALVTSASVHDSQVAIPLMKMTSDKVTYLYDLMDAGYDAELIRNMSRELGHVPIIDRNSRGQDVPPMAPHEAERYKQRSAAERANARLKDDFGAANIRVKGHAKVATHLMFGILTLFADQLIRLLA